MCLHRFLEIVHLQKLALLMCLNRSGKSDSIITLDVRKLSNEWAVCIWQHEYNQDPSSYFKQKVNCSANIWLICRAELEWIFLVFRRLLHHPNVFLSWMWWSLYVWIKASYTSSTSSLTMITMRPSDRRLWDVKVKWVWYCVMGEHVAFVKWELSWEPPLYRWW